MTNKKKYTISCSITSHNFTLAYDGIQTYYLFYDGEIKLEKISDVNPNTLWKQCKNITVININDVDNPLITEIMETIEYNFTSEVNRTEAHILTIQLMMMQLEQSNTT